MYTDRLFRLMGVEKYRNVFFTAGRGGAGQTIISFLNPDGNPDLAMFRNPRSFYMDGERIEPRVRFRI